MTTPIADFVKKYADSNTLRLHMPGHKGKSFLGCEALDITEISGADVLGSADGIIAESEKNASALFKTAHSFYSTEGSSLAVKAMLALIKKRTPSGHRTRVVATRNAHKSFIYACALLDIDVEWIYSKEFTHLCSCNIDAASIETALSSNELSSAVYITSPDYLGNVANVAEIAKVCKKHGVPLLVDNAHGAYLAFLRNSLHPIALGADMCCDSAHKTLPVLTGGAYLHVANTELFPIDEVRQALSLFASTSPSYLTLQSLDICNAYLANGYKDRLDDFIKKLNTLKSKLSTIGFSPLDTEPLKLVFSRSTCAFSGYELSLALSARGIEAEFADVDSLVLMLTPELDQSDLDRIFNAFSTLDKNRVEVKKGFPNIPKPSAVMSIREAMFSSSKRIATRDAKGCICAVPTVSCPPAIPIVVSGEVIDDAAIALMLYYGIETIDVVK